MEGGTEVWNRSRELGWAGWRSVLVLYCIVSLLILIFL